MTSTDFTDGSAIPSAFSGTGGAHRPALAWSGPSAPAEVNRGGAAYVARGLEEKARNRAEATALFGARTLLDPGVVLVSHWHPAAGEPSYPDEHVHMYGGVAVQP